MQGKKMGKEQMEKVRQMDQKGKERASSENPEGGQDGTNEGQQWKYGKGMKARLRREHGKRKQAWNGVGPWKWTRARCNGEHQEARKCEAKRAKTRALSGRRKYARSCKHERRRWVPATGSSPRGAE